MGDPNPAVLDPKFRHALGYAVDTEQIVRTAYQGAAEPGTSIMLPSYPTWHWEPPDDVKFTFDLDKAAEELDAAGYVMGADGKRTLPDGSPIGTLRLFARSDTKPSVDTMDLFQSWLGQLGIDAEVTAMDSSAMGDRILEGTYDVFQWDWYIEPDPDGILGDFTCEQRGNLNDSYYCDAEYDAMYAAQGVEMDKDKRIEIVHQMQQQLYEDAPYIVTAYTKTGEAFRNDQFACFQPQPDPGGVWLVPVRRPQLLAPPAGRGRGRLRRRRDRGRCGRGGRRRHAQRGPRGRGRRQHDGRLPGRRALDVGRRGRLLGAAAAPDRGRPRMTTGRTNNEHRIATEPSRRQPVARAQELRPLRPGQGARGAGQPRLRHRS